MTNTFDPDQVIKADLQSTDNISPHDYWTEERLASAIPIEQHPSYTSPIRNRPPEDSSSSHPKIEKDTIDLTDTFSGKVTKEDLKKRPYSAIGRVYCVFQGEHCHFSASVLNINSGCILTAAHCVLPIYNSQQEYIKNVLFQLQYNEGEAAGQYACDAAFFFNGWLENNKNNNDDMWDYDVAILNSSERPGQYAGGLPVSPLPFEFNTTDALIIGYPGGYEDTPPKFDGKSMWVETYSGYYSDRISKNIRYYGKELPRGSSGGPIMSHFRGHTEDSVTGVVSTGQSYGSYDMLWTSNFWYLKMDDLFSAQQDYVKQPPETMYGYLIVPEDEHKLGPLVVVSEPGDPYWQARLLGSEKPLILFMFSFSVNEYGQNLVEIKEHAQGSDKDSTDYGRWMDYEVAIINKQLFPKVHHSKEPCKWRVDISQIQQVGYDTIIDAYISPGGEYGDRFMYIRDQFNLGGELMLGDKQDRIKFRFQSGMPS